MFDYVTKVLMGTESDSAAIVMRVLPQESWPNVASCISEPSCHLTSCSVAMCATLYLYLNR